MVMTLGGMIALLACATTTMKSNIVSMCVVPVKVKCNQSENQLKTYALLDCCRQEAFINIKLAEKLRTKGIMTPIKIKTLNGGESQKTETISGLKLCCATGQMHELIFQ